MVEMHPSSPTRLGHRITLRLLMVVTAIVILLAVILPIHASHVRNANEAILREDCDTLRNAAASYTIDKNKAPQRFGDLVHAGYIKNVPRNSFPEHCTW
jgi:competence protein ComGC